MEILKEIKSLESESNRLIAGAEKQKERKIEESRAAAVQIRKKAAENGESERINTIETARKKGDGKAREIEKLSQKKRTALGKKVAAKKAAMKRRILKGLSDV